MKFSGPIGVCDQCGRWIELVKLRKQVRAAVTTSLKVCPTCYDEDNPQQFVGRYLGSKPDIQSVKEPRPDPFQTQWAVGGPYYLSPVPEHLMFLSTGKVYAV